jgi:hypothetical protein
MVKSLLIQLLPNALIFLGFCLGTQVMQILQPVYWKNSSIRLKNVLAIFSLKNNWGKSRILNRQESVIEV